MKNKWEYSKSNTGSFIIIASNNYIGSFREETDAKLCSYAPEMLELINRIIASEYTSMSIRRQAQELYKKATE